ncbi:protein kinase domain-containing protein [Microbispora hainanensis]|uniref:non-specific serine/threonine protein kinase n=1 Tax=Microbispora hainanensis TaxID=568844 RepID=A0A544Y484_9ACTN|nr:protein kinase [Microbispora hainanensis]TQS11576.1 protein kinase [Microbispora hainanensis]
MVPSTLGGRYELEELIGQGGMGEVWRGRDLRAHRPVAVKILTPQVAGVASRERFAREARAAARIVHPNVVTVLDVGEQDARPYLVMELLTGRSLAAELQDRGRYGVAEACHLMSQAAAGLDAAHRAGVVHRDVKPANLHLTASGVLKVVDFGVAQVATEAARLTMVGTVVGTAAYLAPEQIDGRGGGSACDLYALGCVCYELLCGHPPFTGSAPELVYQHIHQAPAPPGRHRPDIPAELERLIMALLAKEPASRPADAEVARRILAAVALSAARPAWEAGTPAPPQAPYAGGARAGDTALLDTALLDTPLPDTPLPDTPLPGTQPPGVTSPTAPAGRTAGMSPERRTLLRLGAAVAGLAVVTIGVAALSDGGGQAEPAVAAPSPEATPTGTSPTPARKVSPSPTRATPRPSPKPSPTPSPPRSGRPVYRNYQEWLAAFDHALQEQERRGGIEPRLARDAHEAIRKTARDMSRGQGRGRGGDRSDKAARRIRDILIKLRQAHQAGRIADGPLVDFLNATGISGR